MTCTVRSIPLVAVMAVACYGNHPNQPNPRTFHSSRSTATLSIVEANDRGNFWFADQAKSALDTVLDRARRGKTVTIVFVHGWGHNAKTRDQNLVCFSHTIENLSRRLNTDSVARWTTPAVTASIGPRPTVKDTVRVVGIYVGWRGKSLPEGPGPTSIISRFPTFWARKGTAAKVGNGDLRAFVQRLGAIYDSINYAPSNPAKSAGRADTLFSLVTVGHSFGGQALFPAVASQIENQLHTAARDEAWRALRNEPLPPPANEALILGLGDLVVLVNPAMEASAYERMHRLARQLTFSKAQTPALAVFDAHNDTPRRLAFPVGRFFTTLFSPTGEKGDRERDLVALGRYSPQSTHRLSLFSTATGLIETEEDKAKERKTDNPFDLPGGDCGLSSAGSTYGNDDLADSVAKNPTGTDISAEWRINGKHIEPINRETRQPYAPFVVVRSTERQIINGHNGFFQPQFVDYLIRFVTDIQGKRFSTRHERVQRYQAVER
jgi:hypothetical protein